MPDTFGTPAFLDAFRKPIPEYTSAGVGAVSTTASGPGTTTDSTITSEAGTKPPISAPANSQGLQNNTSDANRKTYAHVYTGVRQDSGEPANFVKMVREFYDKEGITDQKAIVFSDSLNIENCLEYKVIAEESGFKPVFGVGTFFTSMHLSPCLSWTLIYHAQSSMLISDTYRRFHPQIYRGKVQASQYRYQDCICQRPSCRQAQ